MASTLYRTGATDPSVSAGGVVVYSVIGDGLYQNNLAGDTEVLIISVADVAALIPPVGVQTLAFFLPSVSHDGTKVVVHGQINVDELWIIGIDGSNPTQLTNFGTAANVTIRGSWSPDDSQIVFSRFDATQAFQEIWRIDADGTNLTLLESFGGTISAADPNWGSNDIIVFLRVDSPNYQIWTMAPDGSGDAQLTTDLDLTGALLRQPTWFPDALHIAIPFTVDGVNFILYQLDADGSNSTAILSDDPNWSTINEGFAITPTETAFFIIGEEFSIFVTIAPPRLPANRIAYGLGG